MSPKKSGLPGAKEERKEGAGSKGKRGNPGHRTWGTWCRQVCYWPLWAGASSLDQGLLQLFHSLREGVRESGNLKLG